MSGDQLRRLVAAVATLAVAGATFAGSAAALVAIGRHAAMPSPFVLPVGLDGVAIVAATAVQRRRTDRLAWFTLALATVVSTGLQVAAAPVGLANQIPHGVPPIATLLAFELFLRATTVPEPPAIDEDDEVDLDGGELALITSTTDPLLPLAQEVAERAGASGWRTLAEGLALAGHQVSRRRALALAAAVRGVQ